MKNTFVRFLCLFLLLSGCTKTEYRQFDFKGDFKMEIFTYSEFGSSINDKNNFEVTVKGTVPEVHLLTDTSGICTVKDLPYGSYNLIISKPGYGTNKQMIRHMGVDNESARLLSMIQKSSTRILNYNLQITGRILTVTGQVSHNYTNLRSYPYEWPGLMMFVSDNQAVSPTNNYTYVNISTKQTNNTEFQISMGLNNASFPSGSSVFVVIYGRPQMNNSCFDAETGTYYYPALGDPSEVKSIIVP